MVGSPIFSHATSYPKLFSLAIIAFGVLPNAVIKATISSPSPSTSLSWSKGDWSSGILFVSNILFYINSFFYVKITLYSVPL